MGTRIKCSLCRASFPWDTGTKYPDFCACCGEFIGVAPEHVDRIAAPTIKTQSTKNNDKVLRDLADGSEVRAQIAADHLGVPVSEMSDMKVTNFNTRRDAEIAAMPVNNTVTQHMDQVNVRGGNFGYRQNAAAEVQQTYSPGVRTGAVTHNGAVVGNNIEPNAGAKTHASIKRLVGA